MIGKEGKIIEISMLIFYGKPSFIIEHPVWVSKVLQRVQKLYRDMTAVQVYVVYDTPSSSFESINSYTTINHPEWGSSIAPSTIVRPTVSE